MTAQIESSVRRHSSRFVPPMDAEEAEAIAKAEALRYLIERDARDQVYAAANRECLSAYAVCLAAYEYRIAELTVRSSDLDPRKVCTFLLGALFGVWVTFGAQWLVSL